MLIYSLKQSSFTICKLNHSIVDNSYVSLFKEVLIQIFILKKVPEVLALNLDWNILTPKMSCLFKIVVNINKIISWFFKLLKTFRRILRQSRIIVLTSVIPRRRCLTLKENPEKNSNRIMWNTSVTEPLIKQMIPAQTPQPQDCSREIWTTLISRLDAFS